jgi:hypothetical protein
LCKGETELFYGPEDDGRDEEGRAEREDLCKQICWSCPFRLRCLEEALVNQELWGVWGGQGEGERKKFRSHLQAEGYTGGEIPTGLELHAAEKAFRRKVAEETRRARMARLSA